MITKKYIHIISVLIFIYIFVNYSNNIPLWFHEYLSNYNNQLFVLILLLLLTIYIDRFIGMLFFILFFIQFRLANRN